MKIFSNFKNYSRDLKLIIITALIVSCVGVYAAGECIISATAGDVTYNNSTVQDAIDDLYSMSESNCPEGYECTRSLYKMMADKAVLDDRASTYVTSSSGIDFSDISSDTNGKGIYEIASTKNDTYPIYYYRGAVDNNNVKFGGFCWKAIRTTDTGGVKLIYNGVPNGSGYCTNKTGYSTIIGTNSFNTNTNSPTDVGYMFGNSYSYYKLQNGEFGAAHVCGNDVSYSNGTYTLIDTITTSGNWLVDFRTLNNNHYTCYTTGTTCSSVSYLYHSASNVAYYLVLTNGKNIEEALDDMFSNNTDSVIKTQIDTWFGTNLSSYSNFIEDTIYCNDRSLNDLGAFNPDGGNTMNTTELLFGPYSRTITNYSPSLSCSRTLDRFTVSSTIGNGKLTYPVGLITNDEVMYGGGAYGNINQSYYLYNGDNYWTMSPSQFNDHIQPYGYCVGSSGVFSDTSTYFNRGIRPVISISKDSKIESVGNGTASKPYVVKTN